MGCDIHGVVEVNSHDRWKGAATLYPHVGRSYDTFGMLWGVRNNAAFNAAFPKRGFPEERSRQLKGKIEDWGGEEHVGAIDFHSPSYATYSELMALDWDVEAEGRDSRYTVLDENKDPTGTKFGWAKGWSDIIEENKDALLNGEAIPNDDGTHYIKQMKLTRRRALSGAWEWFIFDLLGTYAEKYGGENVRLVVWFDN
jgi:hypothetical protein